MSSEETSHAERGARGPASDPARVCTLPPAGLAERLAWIRQEILCHALERVRLERGWAFELACVPGLDEKLERLVALEGECCPGIAFERVASATPGRLRLEVRGIDPDGSVFRSLGRGACGSGC